MRKYLTIKVYPRITRIKRIFATEVKSREIFEQKKDKG
jgi:hypothetical protein